MKTSWELEKQLPSTFAKILEHDQITIDSVNRGHRSCLNYFDLTYKRLSEITRRFPDGRGISVLDVGCAQGNLTLLLAERGFKVTAIEINPIFLEYAKHKKEKGEVNWILGDFSTLRIDEKFDVVILGEIIEHCAYPEDILQKAFNYLRPKGIILISTPNASMLVNDLPTFYQLYKREDRAKLEAFQFGPDGEDHLFLFKRSELKLILPKDTFIENSGYFGGTILLNSWTNRLVDWLPEKFLHILERVVANTPLINFLTCHGIYAILRKKYPIQKVKSN